MYFQAGETSPACGGVLPSPDQPLASYLCRPPLSDSPSLGIAQPALPCPLPSWHTVPCRAAALRLVGAPSGSRWVGLPSPPTARGRGSSQAGTEQPQAKSLPPPSPRLHGAGTWTAVPCSQSQPGYGGDSPPAPGTHAAVPTVTTEPVQKPSCARRGAQPAPHPRQRSPPWRGAAELGEPDFQNRKVNCYLLLKPLSHFLAPLSFIFLACFLKNGIRKSVFRGQNQRRLRSRENKWRRPISGLPWSHVQEPVFQ